MEDHDPVASLRRALAAAPDDIALRLHLAEVLMTRGESQDAVGEAAAVLTRDAGNAHARRIMSSALAQAADAAFDWDAAQQQVGTVGAADASPNAEDVVDTWSPILTLRDVGGMRKVKERLDAAFIAPLRNPELRAMYGASLRGGLLMYGPPGCGKTFLARAVAGELEASFLSIALHDILDPMLGVSEQALHAAFERAHASAPCVVFLDEVDAIGQRRSQANNSAMRGVVVQLLEELDGMSAANDGVFVLAASNRPWDIDPALRRPGRLDRTLLVLPPDPEAREAIFELHLRDRPTDTIDFAQLAQRTAGYTGADIGHICASAAENALLASVKTGVARPITMADLVAVISGVRSSASPWLQSVRHVVTFGEDDGTFEELAAYLRANKRL